MSDESQLFKSKSDVTAPQALPEESLPIRSKSAVVDSSAEEITVAQRPPSANRDTEEAQRAKKNTELLKTKANLGVHHKGFTVYREAIRSGESCRGMPSLAVEAMKPTTLQFDPNASRKQALVRMAYVPVHHHVIRYLEGLDVERIEGQSPPSVVGRPRLHCPQP